MTAFANPVLEARLPLSVEVLKGSYAGCEGMLLSRWTRPDGEAMGDVELGYGRPLALRLALLGAA